MGELQRANMWKRISAALFDLILSAVVAVGMALLLTVLLGYDGYVEAQTEGMARIEAQYGVDFDVLDSVEEYEKLSEAERARYEEAMNACNTDPELLRVTAVLFNLTLLIITFSLLLAYAIWELVIPLVLGNGQTFGKKLFGLALMREDGVRVTPFAVAVRAVLGKYTVEVMLPVFILVMIVFNMTGIVGLTVLLLLPVVQIILVARTRGRTPIHDLFARTVVVDLASQRIFDSVEEKDAYYLRLHKEMADKADY